MDEAVGERDPAAEAGGQPAGLEVVLDQGEQLVGGVVGVGGDAEGVDPIAVEAAGDESADERDRAQGVVAEHVGDDVPDPPLACTASVRSTAPGSSVDEQVGQVRPLGAGQRHGVHGRGHRAFAAVFA